MIRELVTFQDVVRSRDFVILDTETTALKHGEIVQIAIIDSIGQTLLDTLVEPTQPIPIAATHIHGITDAMVKDAPTFGIIRPRIIELLRERNVIVYNATYDRHMLHSSADFANLPKVDWKELSTWWCAMNAYAEHWGDWNDYHGSFTWQSLSNATLQQGLTIQDAHNALGDCLMTLALIDKVWGVK